MKEIRFAKKSKKQIDDLVKNSPKVAKNIWVKLRNIALWNMDWEGLQGNVGEILKYRVWKYRILYRIDKDTLYVEMIQKRNDVYKRLR